MLFQLWVPRDPNYIRTKFIISYEFCPLQVKLWHMFSGMKMEKYMESELSVIFRVKLVAKNILVGSLGSHFINMMRIKVNKNAAFE